MENEDGLFSMACSIKRGDDISSWKELESGLDLLDCIQEELARVFGRDRMQT